MAGPAELVTDGYDSFFGFAEDAFNKAIGFLGDIQAFEVPIISVNVEYAAPSASLSPFNLPPEPSTPNVNITIGNIPSSPDVANITPINAGIAPVFVTAEPVLAFPPRPDALNVVAPGDAPALDVVTLPATPTLDYPDVPTLRDIVLPTTPDINFPTFNEPVPTLDIDVPTVGITFNETPYTSMLLAETTARIRAMMMGGTGLPPEVEAALFDRARARLDVLAHKSTQEAYEQWSARGFGEPGGELSARLSTIRETNRDATNNLSRDIYIRAQEVEIENLRFAVQQGIALESILIQYAAGYAERALQAQQLTAQVAIDVFNARVNLYNAALTGYRTRADVFRTLIDAERSKIELYRAQIEAAVAIGTLNEQDVRIYAEQVRALQSRVDIYQAQIQAVNAQVEVNKSRIDAYRATVQAFAERVNAKKAEFEAYGEEVRAQSSIVGAYQASVQAFAERTRAYSIGIEAQATSKRLDLDASRLRIEAFQAELQAFRETVNAQVAQAQAATGIYDGQARIYSARLGAEGARVEATSRQFQVEVENARNGATIALQNATTNAENALRAASLALEALKTQASVASQVAAGALSAVNLSASISGSSSDSRNLSVSYSVDGGSGSPPSI